MKKIKSLISLLLVLGILLTMSAAPSFAAGRITIDGTNVTAFNPPGPGSYTVYDGLIIMMKGTSFDYTATVPESGTYHLSFDAKFEYQPTVMVNTASGSLEVADSSGVRKEVYAGAVYLEEGDNKINLSITTAPSSALWLYNIYLEKGVDKINTDFTRSEGAYKNYYLPASIEAEDFDMGANGSYSLSDPVNTGYRGMSNLPVSQAKDGYTVSLRNGEWAKYTFNVSDSGSYNLAFDAESSAQLDIYFDNMQYPISAVCKDAGENHIANVYLEEGEHILKVVGAGTKASLDAIVFTCASESGHKPEDLAVVPENDEEPAEEQDAYRPVWREIWVDIAANGAGDGTKDKPFRTIEEAQAEVRRIKSDMQGDIVVKIMPGEYELEEKLKFTPKDGGINGYRVVYKGANMLEKPLISGGTRISGWQEHENGVWKTTVNGVDDVRQLYVNGFAAQRARSKYVYNFATSWDDPKDSTYHIDGYGISKINFPVLTNGEDVELVYNLLWCNQRIPVKEIRDDGDKWMFIFDQPYFGYIMTKYFDTTNPLLGNKCSIENAYELLDEEGEFYFDKKTKTIYYYPFPEEDMKTSETVVGRCEFMMEIQGTDADNRVEGLEFNNLDFRYGTWIDVNRTGVSVFQADCIVDEEMNSTVQSRGRTLPAQLEIDNARDIHFRNCNFQNLGSTAIGMTDYVNDCTVEGNVFRDSSASAVVVGSWRYNLKDNIPSDLCSDIDISNNVIYRVGNEFYGSVGIGVYYARNVNITHNDMSTLPYTGITLGWGWGSAVPKELDVSNFIVSNNKIYDISKAVRDGGHIYTLGEMIGTEIKENYIELSNDYGGIYFDQGSAMITAYNNVAKDCMVDTIAFGAYEPTREDGNYGQNVYSNWTNRPQSKTLSWPKACGNYEHPIIIEDANWPAEAQAIVDKAGLERGYKRLLDNIEYPSWRTDFYIRPDFQYQSVNAMDVASIDWMSGGEGVGYHDTNTNGPTKFKQGQIQVVGETGAGEWLKYEIDVPRAGDYNFELHYALLFDGAGNLDESNTGVRIYVDDAEVIYEPN
ncbi:MAG: right-handed parallel beta-helix repeat-containing protein, partial [Clostridia bacterium]|nr:right-handed parallel beta-helix repeat-containing protein [Clostridia bacterium]